MTGSYASNYRFRICLSAFTKDRVHPFASSSCIIISWAIVIRMNVFISYASSNDITLTVESSPNFRNTDFRKSYLRLSLAILQIDAFKIYLYLLLNYIIRG